MARYSTGRCITTCRECADLVWKNWDYRCGRRDVRVRPDYAIPWRCPLPVAPEKETQP